MLLTATLLFQINTRPLIVAPQVYRTRVIAAARHVWDPATGAPKQLVTWSVAVDGFWRRNDSLPLAIRYRFEPRGGRREEVEHREIATSKQRHVAGVHLAPAAAGEARWSVRVRVPSPSEGSEMRGSLAPAVTDSFAISDVIVGDATQQLTIRLGHDDVILAPRQAIARDTPLAVYFQVRAPKAADEARLTYRFRRMVGGAAVPEEEWRVTMVAPLQAGITPVEQTLGAERLTGDHYLLEVRVETPGGLVAERTTELHLRAGEG